MPEVLHLATKEALPENSDCVVVERTPNGKFWVNGSVADGESAIFYPAVFDTLEMAITKARAWATRYAVSIVYVIDAAESEGA